MPTIAILGTAHCHTPNFVRMLGERAGVTVKYVYDPTRIRAEHFAPLLGAKPIKKAGKALDDDEVDAVVICSETNLHRKLVKAAAKAGKHMFVEKPLGLRAKDSRDMADAIEAAGVKFQTGYFNRGKGVHRFIREHIEKGTFGQVTRMRASLCHAGALRGWFDPKPDSPATEFPWMADPKIAGCGAFGDLGTHLLDILMWLGGDIKAVAGVVQPVIDRYHGTDESGEALLRFKSGVIGVLAGAWVDVANPVTLQVAGTHAHAAVINNELYFTCEAMGADGKSPWKDLPADLPHAFELFLDALEGKDAELVDPHAAAERVAVMEAVYKAAKHHKWVNVK